MFTRIDLSAIALLIAVSPVWLVRTAEAQQPDYDLAVEADSGGMYLSSYYYPWYEVQNDTPIICRMWARLPGYHLTMSVNILAPFGQSYSKTGSGFGSVTVTAVMPSAWNDSPGEFTCQGSVTVSGGGQASANIDFRATRFWGSYQRTWWDYNSTVYEPYNCFHGHMLPAPVMYNPAPGWPNVNNPPPFMLDEGIWMRGGGNMNFNMHLFLPRDTPGHCQGG